MSRKVYPITVLFLLFVVVIPKDSSSWGFWAHKRINRLATFTLPPEMVVFYKKNIEYVTDHAVDPDKRRYAVDGEAPKHYIDIDHYGEYPFEDFPHQWKDAVEKYTEDTLLAYGIVPWNVVWTLRSLENAFANKDERGVLRYSSDLGHYIADAHVPLHTTENYNGQLTGQKGIHGFWESRVPELNGDLFDYFVGKAKYIEDPLETMWDVVLASHSSLDSVLTFEKELTASFPSDQKYSYEQRGQVTVKVYSAEFSNAYMSMLNGMQERRMRAAILMIGNFWYTAWVNAGQPDLSNMEVRELTEEELEEQKELDKQFQEGKIKGREHQNFGEEIITP